MHSSAHSSPSSASIISVNSSPPASALPVLSSPTRSGKDAPIDCSFSTSWSSSPPSPGITFHAAIPPLPAIPPRASVPQGALPSQAAPTLPVAPAATPMNSIYSVDVPAVLAVEDTLFTELIEKHRDSRGLQQSCVWQLTEIGDTRIEDGVVVTHCLKRGIECFAKVERYITRSSQEALFQIKLLGWQTPDGFRTLDKDIFSYLLCPVYRCAAIYFTRKYSYFVHPFHFNLQLQVLTAARCIKLWLKGEPVNLPPGDHVIGWVLDGFIKSPVLEKFETQLGSGITVAASDLNVRLSDGMVSPPASFNPAALKLGHPTCFTVPPDAIELPQRPLSQGTDLAWLCSSKRGAEVRDVSQSQSSNATAQPVVPFPPSRYVLQ